MKSDFSKLMLEYSEVLYGYAKEFTPIIEAQKDKMNKILEMIDESSAIHIYGKGRSGAIAVCFALRLSHFDFKPVYFLGDVIKKVIDRNDLVFLLSGSGDTSEVVDVARKAKKIGAKVIALTSYKESMLTKNSDLIFFLPGGMEKGKGWSYLEAQLHERPSMYGGGEFELYSYLFQEALLCAIGKHKSISGDIIAKTHERDEVIQE